MIWGISPDNPLVPSLAKSRNKKFRWVTFDHQKRFFHCERCGEKHPETEKGKELDALVFLSIHEHCT